MGTVMSNCLSLVKAYSHASVHTTLWGLFFLARLVRGTATAE